MKKILATLMVVSFACKKEDPKPQPKPCQTTSQTFTGKYIVINGDTWDTLSVVFDRNNCPTEGQNFYKFKNFYNTVKTRMKDTTKFIKEDIEVLVTEAAKTGTSTNNPVVVTFTMNTAGNPYLMVGCKQLNTVNLQPVE